MVDYRAVRIIDKDKYWDGNYRIHRTTLDLKDVVRGSVELPMAGLWLRRLRNSLLQALVLGPCGWAAFHVAVRGKNLSWSEDLSALPVVVALAFLLLFAVNKFENFFEAAARRQLQDEFGRERAVVWEDRWDEWVASLRDAE